MNICLGQSQQSLRGLTYPLILLMNLLTQKTSASMLRKYTIKLSGTYPYLPSSQDYYVKSE